MSVTLEPSTGRQLLRPKQRWLLGFVEVFLDSLTSGLVCHCNGKLCVRGTVHSAASPSCQSSWGTLRLQTSDYREGSSAPHPHPRQSYLAPL